MPLIVLSVACQHLYATTYAYTGTVASGATVSNYYAVTAGGVPIHTYAATVAIDKYANFTYASAAKTFVGGFAMPNTGLILNNAMSTTATSSQGTASYASFEQDGSNHVAVTFPHFASGSSGVLCDGNTATNVTIKVGVTTSGPTGSPSLNTIIPIATSGCVAGTSGSVTFPVNSASVVDPVTGLTCNLLIDPVTGLPGAQQITVEVDGDWMNSLHIFVNPGLFLDPSGPDHSLTSITPVTAGTITNSTFSTGGTYALQPGGTYWVSGNISLPSNTTLYVPDGAFVGWTVPGSGFNTNPMITLGSVTTPTSPYENVILLGNGIIDGQDLQQRAAYSGSCGSQTHTIEINNTASEHVAHPTVMVQGVIVQNSCPWNLPIYNSTGVSSANNLEFITVNNVKIFGFDGNSDGIDVAGGDSYVNITYSFLRTYDDLVTIKQNGTGSGSITTNNVKVQYNTLWNEVAHALTVGAELYAAGASGTDPAVNTVLFDSDYILHDGGNQWLLGIENAAPLKSGVPQNNGTVENVTWSNITVLQDLALASIKTAPVGTSTLNPGISTNIYFTNIMSVPQQTPTASLSNLQLYVEVPNNTGAPNTYVGNGTASGTNPAAIQTVTRFRDVYVNAVWSDTTGLSCSGCTAVSSAVASDGYAASSQNIIQLAVHDPEAPGGYGYDLANVPNDIMTPTY